MISYDEALNKIKGLKIADKVVSSIEYPSCYAFDIANSGDEKDYDGTTVMTVDKETGEVSEESGYHAFMAMFFPAEYDEAEKTYKKLGE